jgi:hypothetical protein
MKRRQFIGLSAYIAAAVAIPFLESCSTGNNDTTVAEPVILLHILNAKSIIETGNAYLKQYPEENSKDTLRQLLLDKNSLAASSGANAIHSWLDKKTVEDFTTGKTVMINGWVLSFTEARQCALYAILQS